KLAKFVEQLKTIKKEVVVQVPKPPLQKIGDVIEDIYAVEKPKQNQVNNPQRAINKGARIAAEQAAKNAVATEQPIRTDVVEEAANAS
ncbi:hypothetical protein Tco_1187057, partial [Tanacetum coccineum]